MTWRPALCIIPYHRRSGVIPVVAFILRPVPYTLVLFLAQPDCFFVMVYQVVRTHAPHAHTRALLAQSDCLLIVY